MLRRDFLALLAAGIASIPGYALAGRMALPVEQSRRDLPLQQFRALLLEREGERLALDIGRSRDYFAACYLLRDVMAGRPAKAHPWLLHTAALIQAMAAKSHRHEVLLVSSGFRTPQTNRKVGGAEQSYHMANDRGFFHAMDFHMPHVPLEVLARYALTVRQGGVGVYRNKDFLHIDVGAPRAWVDV